MAAKTEEKAVGKAAEKPEVRKFSKAQKKRFNELQANAQRAQGALQEFVNYLGEEHGLEEGEQWTLGPEGFVRAASEPPPLPDA